jgi:hypothetical protein
VASFATSAELGNRLGLTLTAGEQTRADALLALASGLIKQETRQTIEQVAGDTLTRPGSSSDRIRLPQRPVVSVASVTVDGVAMTAGQHYYVDSDELVRLPAVADTTFGLGGAGWGYPWSQVVVVYTHGYSPIPELVKAICMEMVVRVWVNPGSVIQESEGNTNVTYAPFAAPPRGLLLTDNEKRDLNKLLRPQVSSISLR